MYIFILYYKHIFMYILYRVYYYTCLFLCDVLDGFWKCLLCQLNPKWDKFISILPDLSCKHPVELQEK